MWLLQRLEVQEMLASFKKKEGSSYRHYAEKVWDVHL